MISSTSILSPALNLFDAQLEFFATSPEYQSDMILLFGENHNYTVLQQIFIKKAPNVLNLIEIIPIALLNGAYGGFSRDTNQIYLASEFINSATPLAIADVILEEYGHYIDAQLNPVETIGDEGEIFADLVQGNSINPAAFTEDDTEIINIDGNWITVEQAAGDLDPSFGENGLVRTLINGLERISVAGIKVQADGKIVIAGTANELVVDSFTNFVAIRYNSDGTQDTTFNNGYIGYTDVRDDDSVRSLALQPDGKIVVAGYSNDSIGPNAHVTILRYNNDGSLDTSFSGDGIVITNFDNSYALPYDSPVVLQPDGKILIVGYSNYLPDNSTAFNENLFLGRYNSDGSLDTSFDNDGKVYTERLPLEDVWLNSRIELSMVLQPDSKIVVGCTLADYVTVNNQVADFGMLRFNSDGSRDLSFGSTGDGISRLNTPNSFDHLDAIALQLDGKIIAAGCSGNDANNLNLELVRVNTNGSLDTSFGAGGTVFTDLGSDVVYAGIQGLTLQANGKIVVAATLENSSFVLVRYNNNGTLDTSFGGGDGIAEIPFNNGSYDEAVTLQEDGKILVAGVSGEAYAVARFLGDPVPVFEAAEYGASNPDLIPYYINSSYNLAVLTDHYLNYGRLEGRPTDSFDPFRYTASSYTTGGDLINAFQLNAGAATLHYLNNGFTEGRSTTAFIPSRYLDSYNDLLNVFGTNTFAATQHYITSGFTEGRNPNLFPSARYIASYGDLIQAFSYNLEAGSNHYLYSGRSEGRQVTFDPQAYLNRYIDLQAVFGNDLNAATEHYIEHGYAEGRTWL